MPVGDVSSPHPHSVSATDFLSRVAITMSVVYKFGVYSENIHGIFGCIDLIRTLYVSSASFFCIKAATLLHIHTGVTFDCGLLLTEHVPVAQGLTVTCDSRAYSRQQPVAFSRFLPVGRRAACG